jgi:excisionase family DNA binding protein
MEEYLTVKELSDRIKLARQTIYNMIHKKDFVLNIHYHKPKPKIILFKWSAIEKWLEGSDPELNDLITSHTPNIDNSHSVSQQKKPKSSINI